MTYFVQYGNGQPFPLHPSINPESDDMVRKAIAAFYPGAMNSTIERVPQGEDIIIKVNKKAGDKGGSREFLIAAPDNFNPAIAMSWSLKRLEMEGAFKDHKSVVTLAKRFTEIETASIEGRQIVKAVRDSRERLIKAPGIPAPRVVEGF